MEKKEKHYVMSNDRAAKNNANIKRQAEKAMYACLPVGSLWLYEFESF